MVKTEDVPEEERQERDRTSQLVKIAQTELPTIKSTLAVGRVLACFFEVQDRKEEHFSAYAFGVGVISPENIRITVQDMQYFEDAMGLATQYESQIQGVGVTVRRPYQPSK